MFCVTQYSAHTTDRWIAITCSRLQVKSPDTPPYSHCQIFFPHPGIVSDTLKMANVKHPSGTKILQVSSRKIMGFPSY